MPWPVLRCLLRGVLVWALGWLLPPVAGAAPTIVFKLDDLSDAAYARDGFARAFRVLEQNGVRGSFGLITRSCADDGSKAGYFAQLRSWATSGRIELWHHGWDHRRGEFRGTDAKTQLAHLRDGLSVVHAACGVAMTTFGAPYGEVDVATVEALNALPEITGWFAQPAPGTVHATFLAERAAMEVKTGVVSYERFVENFERKKGARYLVVLGHPPYWDDASHHAFERVIAFCREQGCSFATPAEMVAQLRGSP